MQLERRVLRDDLGVTQELLEGRVQQRRPVGQLARDLARLGHRLALRHEVVAQSPVLGLGRVHPATGHQHLDGDVVRDAAAQLDAGGIRYDADVDLGEREARLLLHDNQVAAEHELEAAPAGDAVDRGDQRLVEVAGVVEPAEAAHAPVGVGGLTRRGVLEVPARREELLAGTRDDRDAQRRIGRELRPHAVEPAAHREVDCIGLQSVEGDLEDRARALGPYSVRHISGPPPGE